MIAGLVYPVPYPETDTPDVAFLRLARETTGLTHLRFNLDYRNPHADRMVDGVQEASWQPWPILDGPMPAWRGSSPHQWPDLIRPYVLFAIRACTAWRFPYVELLNEPRTLGGLRPEFYAALVNATSQELRTYAPETHIVVAGEMIRADRQGPKRDAKTWWWPFLRAVNPQMFDGVAIHPYRNPGSPQATRDHSRQHEHAWYQKQSRMLSNDTEVHGTEVGYDLRDGVDEFRQAAYLVEELTVQERVGMSSCFLYAHQGPFGLFREDQSPRPAAHAIHAWAMGQPEAA